MCKPNLSFLPPTEPLKLGFLGFLTHARAHTVTAINPQQFNALTDLHARPLDPFVSPSPETLATLTTFLRVTHPEIVRRPTFRDSSNAVAKHGPADTLFRLLPRGSPHLSSISLRRNDGFSRQFQSVDRFCRETSQIKGPAKPFKTDQPWRPFSG